MVSLLRGIVAGGASQATLWTAWLSLLAFTVLGAVIGWLAERIVRESVSGQILSELQREETRGHRSLPASRRPVSADNETDLKSRRRKARHHGGTHGHDCRPRRR